MVFYEKRLVATIRNERLSEAKMSFAEIVTKVNQQPLPSTFEVSQFEKAKPGQKVAIEVNLVAEPEDKMRKWALVMPNVPGWGAFVIRCDEGTAIGGGDMAPPPLSYFAAGIAFCLLTHLTFFIHKERLDIKSLKIEQRLKFSRALPADIEVTGEPHASCDGLESHVIIESSELPEKIKALVQDAKRGCMATQAVINATPDSTHIHLNGKELQ